MFIFNIEYIYGEKLTLVGKWLDAFSPQAID